MFAPHWHSDHAVNAKGLLVKFPETDQLLNGGPLGCATAELWYISRILDHADRIKIRTEKKAYGEKNVEYYI